MPGKQIINLGYANGWKDGDYNSELVREIREKGGKFEMFNIGRCDNKFVYEDDEKVVIYYVDSSD